VDFIKAFESVTHSFIKKTLAHFNFGERLIGMVMTLLLERKACVDLGGTYSGSFNMKKRNTTR